jgi:hypothetical protein
MSRNEHYVTLDGDELTLAKLDSQERRLVTRMRRLAKRNPGWDEFDNFALNGVQAFYEARGVPRKSIRQRIPFQIAIDLSARLGIAQGFIRPPDYLDQLEDLVLNHFPSRKAFCQASGISPTMLSHVLAGRKDLSLESLSKALERIGYRLRFVPATGTKRTG